MHWLTRGLDMGKNKLAIFGLSVLVFFTALAIFAPVIAPYDPTEIVAEDTMGPSTQHWFGTDDYGRDIFSRAVYGARISLTVGLVAVSISISIGVLLGALAGYFGGWTDSLIMRFVDVMLSFPSIFLILTIQAMLTPNIYNVMVVIGITSWMGVARLVRGEYLKIRELSYVEAARAIGCSNKRIIFRHILPNAQAPIIVAATLGMAGAILTESALSFLGMGVQPPMPSWGNMLMDAQAYMRDAPWMAVIPGLLILITVLSLYFIGEGLREKSDVRS
ncbi:peptide ABC transporter permease [candidate division WOR-1 bacterium RIFOXYB2_FULL_42_35]|uniref:Peptide ABC transporter permease n=1 Tax=candidate division WOR-1 bacterium RIFOXYC2_FULL_41_25 TaxID=1802586 RepID=A0A1F4TQS3_UNCSA|nr:MAG: peptide ABC transporter permease [candidate division WOR-1 bacterium RIFOXYA2_FULL_41_14]OGC25507.1 MAG: peptide ABC transporter permease [candidate division WOR-1 bacterium RIFOXYB2_FULL_42_35]OGC34939.1 MAG: peptide ABC transporter permease [candidate division WOR-1 bacterium RIFOXYC2_FULL_41_25]OGC42010.1 MAG: peptide ABC transporter permease [candidate division WOR-1 bacterium RIFOXYD2_FULL_41_8]